MADQVSAGGGRVAATETIVAAGTWRLAGQLSDAATVSAVTLLSRVPGVTVVTAPPRPATTAATVPTRQNPAPGGKGKDNDNDKDKGKGKDD